MLTSRTLVFLFWLLGAAVTLALSILCLMTGSNGKISALALIPFGWTVALLAGALQHLRVGNKWDWAVEHDEFPPKPPRVVSAGHNQILLFVLFGTSQTFGKPHLNPGVSVRDWEFSRGRPQ